MSCTVQRNSMKQEKILFSCSTWRRRGVRQRKRSRSYSIIGFSDNHHAIAREWADFQEFDPNQVLDGLIAKMRLENDAALASKLQVIQPIIRMIREGSLAMNPVLFLSWIQVATGIGANEL